MINSLKHKPEDEQKSAKSIKKPKRAEVNYVLSHPPGETDDALENLRLDLIAASKRKDSVKSINFMITRYSWRRKEVVAWSTAVAEFKERWPDLFEPFQVNDLSFQVFLNHLLLITTAVNKFGLEPL